MQSPFFQKLQSYYSNLSASLRFRAAVASIFSQKGDIGTVREHVYAELLRSSLPSACNVSLGGFLFNIEGEVSHQIDIIVTSDTCPQFNFHNHEGRGKTFSCIDGTLAVVSLKSVLNKAHLHEAMDNLASIPSKQPLKEGMVHPLVTIEDYDDWPYKIIYAPNGIQEDSLEDALFEYVRLHATRPFSTPNVIHVGGKYSLTRVGSEGAALADGTKLEPHDLVVETDPSDAGPMVRIAVEIQERLQLSRQVLWDYRGLSGNFKIPVRGLSYEVTETTSIEQPDGHGKSVSRTIAKGTRVRLLVNSGTSLLVELATGERVQIPSGCLKRLRS